VASHTSVLPVAIVRQRIRLSENEVLSQRLACVDLLRGVVMILMALDHTRDFFSSARFAPEDLAHTSGTLFLTRFVTHFCAPAFFLLAGTSGYLSLSQGKSAAQVSRFFWTRGLWLMLLDLTVMGYAWTYVLPFWFSGVLWALGCSMIAMTLLIRLPLPFIAAVGTGIIVGNNLLDTINPATFGRFAGLWFILRGHGVFPIGTGGQTFFVLFSVVPWVGVMAVGYALGGLLRRRDWRKLFFGIGAVLTIVFLLLRVFHLYGNSEPALQPLCADAAGPWKVQATLALTVISFFDTLKYPASLQFLLMTLGPCLMFLAWAGDVDGERGLAKILVIFGRVPLFYYGVHLYMIHALAVLVGLICGQKVAWLLYGGPMLHLPPAGYGHGLPFIYAMWFAVLVLLYPLCKLFAEFKQQHPDRRWLRYL
jgi:uncharacterized membrane protein